jgi:hypothetical protein
MREITKAKACSLPAFTLLFLLFLTDRKKQDTVKEILTEKQLI